MHRRAETPLLLAAGAVFTALWCWSAPLHAAEPAFDPFVALPARILDGTGVTMRVNAIPDNKYSTKGTQVSVEPLELFVFKRIKMFSLGLLLPLSINPDRSTDDFVVQMISFDINGMATDGKIFRLCSGARMDFALNAGISDPNYPGRETTHTFKTYINSAVRFGGFSPQLNIMWHYAFRTKPYSGAWYQDAANGFAIDVVFPYYFEREKLAIMIEFNFDRDIDHGHTQALVTPGIRFKPHPQWHFGLAVAVPVLDTRFTTGTGIGVITNFMYEFEGKP
jgi:hypothetical protein